MKFINNITSTLIALVILSQTSYSLAREDGLPESFTPYKFICGDYEIKRFDNDDSSSDFYLKVNTDEMWIKGTRDYELNKIKFSFSDDPAKDLRLLDRTQNIEKPIYYDYFLWSEYERIDCIDYRGTKAWYDEVMNGVAGTDRMPDGNW